MILLVASLALAHGGEDHGAPAPVPAAGAETASVAASGSVFEAVVRAPKALSGDATLLLADWATSAPVGEGTAALTLSGPGAVHAEFAPTASRGVWTAPMSFPAAGSYAGALVVTSGERTDLLAISGLTIGEAAAHDTAASVGWGLPIGIVCAGVALALGLGAGWLLGRRAGAAAGLLFVAVATERVHAHGGEDHGAPAAAAPVTGSALSLRMESQFLLEIRTQPLRNDLFSEQIEGLGRYLARPGATATLRAPVAGVLRAPDGGFPAPGSEVRAGDVLAIIAETGSAGERAALAQNEAEVHTRLAEARAALALAERDAARAAELGDAISDRERLQREQTLVATREALRHAERARDVLGSRAQVRAPLAGRLAHSEARPGDNVEAGDPLFRIVDGEAMWVEVEVPERAIAQVAPGAAATVASPTGGLLDAVVLDAGQEVDPATGHVTLTLAVQAQDPSLRPGMSATAWIEAGGRRDALVVPDAAVIEAGGETLVFVKTGPESFAARTVRLGARSADLWEVTEGLAAGERVVVQGTYALRSLAGR